MMSTPEERDWVRQGTPRDVDAEWNDEQSEYGTTVSPVEWDDYSSEQSVPVERPRPVVPPPVDEPADPESLPTADAAAVPEVDHPADAGAADEQAPDAVPEAAAMPDEPAGDEAVTSDDAAVVGAPLEDQPVLVDADSGLEPDPEPVDEPGDAVDTDVAGADRGEDVAPGTEIPEPVAGDGPSGFERPEEESYEEASLEEPSIDDYDEPQDDVPSEGAPPAEPFGDAPVEEDAPVVEDDPNAEVAPLEEDVPVEDSAPVEDGQDDAYDPDATRVTPVVGPDADAADERTAGDDETVADEDPDATQVVPAVAVGAAGAAAATGASPLPEDLYRTGETAVIDDRDALAARAREADEAEARERELQAQLASERRARDERLGVVETSSENEVRDPATLYKVSSDRFFGSLGLFVLRLVTATILGVTGYQVLTGVDRTTEFLAQTAIPEPRLVTWILGFTLGALALLLVIGLIQRVVGVVLLLLSIGSLVFIRWGAFSPFVDGREGFLGDKTLLLAAVGFVLIGIGGGLWGVDGAFRRARAAAKAEKS